MSRAYHNLTSRYNIYFNGNESFKKGVAKAEKDLQDNFTSILPVFYYSHPSVPPMVTPEMTRAIEKATKVIALHSITAKPELKKGPQTDKQKEFYNRKEFNKWVDDNYMLIGKAYVYKNEFYFALETFRKVITDFPADPVRFEAMVWMASVYIEMKEYREAERILISLKDNKELPKKITGTYQAVWADLQIREGRYDEAIPWMILAIDKAESKLQKIRYNFILAQLYQESKNSVMAVKTYEKVISMNPPYSITFNAKINMATSFEKGTEGGREITSLLKKLLKDEKNKDYLDQIYYALGQIALKDNREKEAIDLFKTSIRSSTANFNQKGLSYLALADLYYSKPEYSLAQAYYDSTMQSIDNSFEDYEKISVKTRSLTLLVEHLVVYQLEDSVQRLARMSESERFAIIDNIIKEITDKEEEERKRQQEESLDTQYGLMMNAENQVATGENQGGKWYFYNFNAKSFGQPEFRMKWGNRRLEDNWRRKNKQTVEFVEQPEEKSDTAASETGSKTVISNKSREFYLKNIPLTDSALKESDIRIENALYHMGLVYRDEMKDVNESVRSFEELLKRYPDGEHTLMTLYSLYELYLRKGDTGKSNLYRDMLISRYPDNPRARLLSDPDYVKQLDAEQRQVSDLYEKAYQNYQRGAWDAVIADANRAIATWPKDRNIPRFRLLKALSLGKTGGPGVMKDELEKLRADYPGHEVSNYAGELIAIIFNVNPEVKMADQQQKAVQIYSVENNSPHLFAIVCFKGSDVNQLNFNLINFNLDHFNRQSLAIEKVEIAGNTLLLVSPFKDLNDAQSYLKIFSADKASLLNRYEEDKARIVLISPSNLESLRADGDFEKYWVFYRNFYPQD